MQENARNYEVVLAYQFILFCAFCLCSGASDRVEHCACIVLEHGLERTEVGFPEFVEQALQHNAELRRCHVSTCPRERTSPKALVHAEKYV